MNLALLPLLIWLAGLLLYIFGKGTKTTVIGLILFGVGLLVFVEKLGGRTERLF